MNYDFTGKSIKCETWEQMLHLAEIAKKSGISEPIGTYWFNEHYFNDGYKYFVVSGNGCYSNDVSSGVNGNLIKVNYLDFIATPPLPTETIEVTGCDGCPMYIRGDIADTCLHPKYEWVNKYEYPFTYCPLKTKSITIKLKNNEPTGN